MMKPPLQLLIILRIQMMKVWAPPDYYKIWSLQNATNIQLIDSKFPGVQLLNERANNQQVESADQRRIYDESKREWSLLQKA